MGGRAHRAGCGAAGLLLGAQVAGIALARFTDARYFCWAPFHSLAEYTLEVEVGGRRLGEEEVRARYRLSPGLRTASSRWVEENAIRHVLDVVRQDEEARGERDRARVEVRYRVNGGAEETWTWPPR